MRRLNLHSLNLISDNTAINRPDRDRRSPLMRAVSARNYPLVKALLARGSDVRQKDRRGDSVLSYAVGDDRSLRIIRLLLRYGADVNDYWGNSLATWAVVEREPLLVSLYLKKGGNPNTIFGSSHTLPWAIDWRNDWILNMLVLAGAELNYVMGEPFLPGATPLMSIGENPQIVRHMLERGADINAVDDGGKTVLMGYATWGDLASIQLLLEAGVDVRAMDQNGSTALNYARKRKSGQDEAVRLLRSYNVPEGAPVSPIRYYG